MDVRELPPTGTCEVSTQGRRSSATRRVEIWYVVVDGRLVLTGTPGPRHWLANLRAHPHAWIHLRSPVTDVAVLAEEVTDPQERRRIVESAWRLQPWYAEQPYSVEDWVQRSPMVVLVPVPPEGDRSARGSSSGDGTSQAGSTSLA